GESDPAPTDRNGDGVIATWLASATVANQPYLLPDPRLPPRAASHFTSTRCAGTRRPDDLTEAIRTCQALVEERGLEMLVLDQTRPDIGLPVVKVIVPG